MKKILLLSSDFEQNVILNASLYRFGFRMIQLKSASEVIKDFECGNRYDLYVFDVKARNLNLDLVKFIRDSQNITPIMLLLDESVPSVFKRIYYARVNDFIIKPFCPEEFLFHVFRLCKVLLGSKFELKNGLVFDKDSLCIRKEGEVIYLGKKESQLLEILCKNSPHVVTYDEIDHHLYKNETLSQDRIRSLVREIRAKIPTICLKTVRGTGYKVE